MRFILEKFNIVQLFIIYSVTSNIYGKWQHINIKLLNVKSLKKHFLATSFLLQVYLSGQ